MFELYRRNPSDITVLRMSFFKVRIPDADTALQVVHSRGVDLDELMG